ncbi:MAG: dihydrodipicolinate synthase family protein, partial [Chloroflexota bacterium]
MLDPQQLHGVIPPVITPLTTDGHLDVATFERVLNFLIAEGVHGLFVLGSTSEFAALTDADREQSMRVAVKVAAGRVPVLASITETSTLRVLAQGERAKAAGIDAVVLAAPHYHAHSQAELMELFRTVKRVVGLPIMAYDIPVLVKVKLEARTVIQLASEGTITGLKDSSGHYESFREIIIGTKQLPNFRIFTGSELVVDMALLMGAHGVVPGVGNVVPRDYVNLYDAAKRGDWAEAGRIQEKLFAFFNRLIRQGRPEMGGSSAALGGFKAGLKALGVMPNTTMAPPMLSFTAAEEAKVAAIMREFG